MASDDKYDKNKLKNIHYLNPDHEDDDETGTGSGGQSGGIDFVDFLSNPESIRDDLLSPEQKKQLLSNHQDINEDKVKKQKSKRDDYKALKDGKTNLQAFRAEKRGDNAYKTNPILAASAQFSGAVDKQVNPNPQENNAETNNEKKNELRLNHDLKHDNKPAPQFNPTPRPY